MQLTTKEIDTLVNHYSISIRIWRNYLAIAQYCKDNSISIARPITLKECLDKRYWIAFKVILISGEQWVIKMNRKSEIKTVANAKKHGTRQFVVQHNHILEVKAMPRNDANSDYIFQLKPSKQICRDIEGVMNSSDVAEFMRKIG